MGLTLKVKEGVVRQEIQHQKLEKEFSLRVFRRSMALQTP